MTVTIAWSLCPCCGLYPWCSLCACISLVWPVCPWCHLCDSFGGVWAPYAVCVPLAWVSKYSLCAPVYVLLVWHCVPECGLCSIVWAGVHQRE